MRCPSPELRSLENTKGPQLTLGSFFVSETTPISTVRSRLCVKVVLSPTPGRQMLQLVQVVLLLIFPLVLIAAALRDLTSFTIPNWMSGLLIVAFFPTAVALGLSLPQVGAHAAVGALALGFGVIMFALRWIGGGDAKLFAAAGLWLGWAAAGPYLFYTAVAGGALALALIGLRSMWMRALVDNGPGWIGRLATPGESTPYGVAIAVGAMAAFPSSALMRAWGGL